MQFQTKEDIEKIIDQMQFLVSAIDSLIGHIGVFVDFARKSDSVGLSNHLQNIQLTLSEARELFVEQIALYTLLSKQFGLPNVGEAEETLGRIKGLEREIIMKKGRLKYQMIVLPQMLILFEGKKMLPVQVKEKIAIIQNELELVSK
ncbi:Uncharacterised protein [uncultured archaeon]|nr:Uncharacterised protein [uncultured archaeon]